MEIFFGGGTSSFPVGASPMNSQSAISQWSWGFHTIRGGIDPRDHCIRPLCVRFFYGRISDPGMGPYLPRVALVSRTPAIQ